MQATIMGEEGGKGEEGEEATIMGEERGERREEGEGEEGKEREGEKGEDGMWRRRMHISYIPISLLTALCVCVCVCVVCVCPCVCAGRFARRGSTDTPVDADSLSAKHSRSHPSLLRDLPDHPNSHADGTVREG